MKDRTVASCRAMTADELTMAVAVGRVRCVPGSMDKRFLAHIAAVAALPVAEVTEKQARYLRFCVHRYRRQLPADVIALAGERPADPWSQAIAAPHAYTPPPSHEPTTIVPTTPQLSLL